METEQAGNAVDQPIKKEYAAMGETGRLPGSLNPRQSATP